MADILRGASDCQAAGIVLATHDLGGQIAGSWQYEKMTMDLYRKGEAIGTYLLDHFVLTTAGWKRLLVPTRAGRF